MSEDIEKAAEEIIQSFLQAVRDLPETKETYYSYEMYNTTREDAPPNKEKLAEFRKRFLSIAPKKDEEGNIRVEVATWVER
ncbi:MAG: hypothetical protein QXX33_02695 [Candidatus Hadarchaeales archaeon]